MGNEASPATAADNTAPADPASARGETTKSTKDTKGPASPGGQDGGQASEAILKPDGSAVTSASDASDGAILVPDPASPDGSAVTSGGKEQGAREVPEQYEEFRMPEGFVLEGEAKEKVTGLFRELNLSQESAQKLIDYATERDLAGREAMLNELAAKRKEWRSSLRARPNFEADLALARKGMKALVRTPEGAELFNDSWMSDHPAVFDIFVRAGRLVAEDTFDNQNGGSAEENVNLRRFPVK